MKREAVDFFLVRDEHHGVHRRLEAWARWVRPEKARWMIQPMFRQYRSHAWQWETPELRPALNTIEAHAMEKAVSALPAKHRDALRWAYVFFGASPVGMARRLAVSKDGLLALLHDGRQMLVNRGA